MAVELDRRQFLKLGITALAATTLSLEQVGWLAEQASGLETSGIADFEKYVVSEINKMPEKEVGRIVKIETIHQETSMLPLMRGLSVNKYYNGGKYWAFSYDPQLFADIDARNKFINEIAMQLRIAFKT